MLESVRRKWMKTPVENVSTILREIPSIDSDTVTQLLSSAYLGEGVYGFEVVSEGDEIESLLITPSLFREPMGTEVHRDYEYLTQDLTNLHCYDIVLSKPSFLPLFTKEPFPIIENLVLLLAKQKQMYLQCLLTKRIDNWQLGYIDQFESYVKKGNDFPSTSRFKRKLQERMLKVIDKVSGSSSAREKVPEIEQKILEHGYRFELRLMFYCHENTSEIESEIRDILKELNFFNELALVKNKEKRTFLDLFLKRKYSGNSVDQMVSEAELLVILSGDVSVGKPDSILQAMEKTKQEVISRTITGSAIHLLPKPKKTEREVDVTISNMIPQALHTSKILKNNQKITIKSVETGPTVQIITCDIPQGAVFSDFRKRHEDLEAVLARKDMLSIIPGREPNTISFLLPLKKKEVIYLIEILQNPEFIQFAENAALPFVCGIDIFNNLVFKDLADGPHLLVCGSTNSGKSVFLNALLITLILMKKPDEMRMIMIDPKQVELTPYSGMAHVDTVITDMEEAYSTLESLCDEMDSRYTLFAKTGVKKIAQYNKKVKKKLPYVVAVVEEYADLHAVHPEVEDLIARLGAKARAAGIHLIIVTQKPNKDIISTVIQNNLPSKICFKLTKTQDYVPIFGSGIGYRLFGSGDGVVAFQNQTELFIRFQSACISPDGEEEELSLEKIKGFYKGEMVEGLDLAPSIKEPEEEPIDKLKRIIQETGETRVQPLASQMRIRTADVTDMLRQLVEDGFLTREGRGYALSNEPKQIVLPEQEEQTGEGVEDPLFNDAVQLVIDINEASISAIQRRFRIGYTRAAKLIDGMEQMGIVSEYNGIGTRRVLIDKNEWDNH